jgi:hypothetical protein
MSNRKKKLRFYHVKYQADFLVPAMSSREAYDDADEALTEMVEGNEMELDDIFKITIETDRFHIVDEMSDDESEDGSDDDEEDEEDEEDEDNDEEDDDDIEEE